MKQETRQKVLNKYDNHCAYCGNEITLKSMQVDHLISKANWMMCIGNKYQIPKGLEHLTLEHSYDTLENLMPSCRRCNHYKRAESLENFREMLKTLHVRLEKLYTHKVALDYGIVTITPFNGTFYFERI